MNAPVKNFFSKNRKKLKKAEIPLKRNPDLYISFQEIISLYLQNCTQTFHPNLLPFPTLTFWSSPRPISSSQRLRLSSTFSTFFQFIVFNNFELFLLLLQFSLLFLNCFCCVCVVFSDVDYNTTLQRVCQQVFSFFCSLKTAKK